MPLKPEVFIIESLELEDEKDQLFEGRILAETLRLSGRKPLYYYFRTKQELKALLVEFKKSRYWYLHLSCHGTDESISTTLDSVTFQELGELLNPYLERRRLFVSSCEVVNDKLAHELMPSGCWSIIGPSIEVDFDAATVFWASFYYLLLVKGAEGDERPNIRDILDSLEPLFELQIRYFIRLKSGRYRHGWAGDEKATVGAE